MVMSKAVADRSGNALLAQLSADDWAQMSPRMEAVTLVQKRVIYDAGGFISHVYFPQSGMVSFLAVLSDGTGIETASAGREGMVGMPVFYGTDRFPEQAVVQLPGRALRMTSGALSACLLQSESLRASLQRYAACLFAMAGHSSLCLARHKIANRLARWILQAADQSGTENLALTHNYIAQLLGVRRASVTQAAGQLQRLGLIRLGRKRVTVVDRPGLAMFACDCYATVRDVYERMLFGAEAPFVST